MIRLRIDNIANADVFSFFILLIQEEDGLVWEVFDIPVDRCWLFKAMKLAWSIDQCVSSSCSSSITLWCGFAWGAI